MATKSEILHEVVAIAINNGWGVFGLRDKNEFDWHCPLFPPRLEVKYSEERPYTTFLYDTGSYRKQTYYPSQILYDHDFAKSLFGQDYIYYLRQMVTFKDPFDYLSNINLEWLKK